MRLKFMIKDDRVYLFCHPEPLARDLSSRELVNFTSGLRTY